MEKLKQIIDLLEKTRIDQELSYEQVAKKINSSRSNVWKCLTGLSIPNSETLLLLIDCLGFNFVIQNRLTLKDISRGDVPEHLHKEFIDSKLKVEFIPKDNPLVEGSWIEESGKLDKNKFAEVIKRKAKSIPRNTLGTGSYDETLKVLKGEEKKVETKKTKETSKDCPNCKYSETASGLKIKVLKCDDCKKVKK